MATSFPALKGRMGDTDFFATVLTLGEVAKMVEFVEDVDDWDDHTDPESKSQRKLNTSRVERDLVPYLLEAPDHFYSALTVEVRPSTAVDHEPAIPFEPQGPAIPGGIEYGMAVLDGTQTLYALDGQHRLKSIQRAIRLRPSLAREQISVILVPFRSQRRSQLLFSDLNRFAKTPSKSISLLFSHRDPVVTVAKSLMTSSPLLRGRVEMETTSLGRNSANFVTLSTLYEFTRTLAGDANLEDAQASEAETARQAELWQRLAEAVPPWCEVAERVEHPAYLRQRYLCMHGVGQQAIGLATAITLARCEDGWARLARLGDVDWTIANHDWQGIAVQGRRVNNTAPTVRNLGAYLAFQLGCPLTASEAGSLISVIRGRGDQPQAALLSLSEEQTDAV